MESRVSWWPFQGRDNGLFMTITTQDGSFMFCFMSELNLY